MGTTPTPTPEGVAVAEPEYADRSDYSPAAWRVRVKAARFKVDLDRRRGLETPQWIQELAREQLPPLEPPVKRRRVA